MQITSAPAVQNSGTPKRIVGQTAHQIFSTEKFIFKVTQTFETLYRISFCTVFDGDEVYTSIDNNSRRAYRRVKAGESILGILRKCRKDRIKGFPTEYLGDEYELYVAKDSLGYGRAYIIVKFGQNPYIEKNNMYFVV